MNSVKVSVIMPSLNVAGYIDEAIASARQQALEDIEIICIDAGSTDGTREKIAKHASEDDRIAVIDSPVKSYGHQVNMGLDIAMGEYVAILETDDYVDADMYGSLYELAAGAGLDYAKCDYDTYYVDERGERIFALRRVGRDSSYYETSFTPSGHPDVAFDDWYLWNGIYRADFLKDNGIRFFETAGAAFQDVGFLHRTTSAAKSVRYLAKSLYRYCVSRPEASSNSDRTLTFIRQEYGILCDEIERHPHPDSAGLKLLYTRMAKSYARACMDCSDECLENDEGAAMTDWFRQRLLRAEEDGYVSSELLPSGLRAAYEHLVCEGDFTAYRRSKADRFRAFFGNDHPIVIFGCGNYGREALGYIKGLGYAADCFMDNSEKMWGRSVAGVKVKDPALITFMPEDTRYIVANENHADEIAAQIREPVGKDRIMIF